MKEKIIKFVKKCFQLGSIPTSANKSFIVFICKSEQASNFKHFYHISLCNFAYKVVAKILAEHLSKVLEKIISPNQSAFIKTLLNSKKYNRSAKDGPQNQKT